MAHWQPVEQVAPQRRIGSTTSTTGPIKQAGPSLGRDPDVASDRLSTVGQSITACRSLAAPVIVNRAARTAEVVWSTGARRRADPTLPQRLREEWPGILRWMIDGCLAWQAGGLARPTVLNATADYFEEQDVLKQWIEECCDQSADWGETSTALFASWRSYALSRAEDPRNGKWFATMLERQGFARAKDCRQFRGRGFVGIRVKPESVRAHWQDGEA